MLTKETLAPGGRSDMGRALMLGLNFAVGMAVFSFIGFYIDQKRGNGIIFTILGIILGLAYGAYEVWKVIQMLQEQVRKDCSDRGAPGTAQAPEPPPPKRG